MERTICCVCEKPIVGQVIQMGHRAYCADCHARVTRNRRGLWWATLIGIGILVVFVAVIAIIASQTNLNLQGAGLVAVGIVLSVVPAILWLGIFYLQDTREPEPKQLVLAVFILGALLAQAVGQPAIQQLYRLPEWIGTSTLFNILGGILVTGFITQFLVYASVRYTVYNSAEFDERVDGIIYGVAAALGYATVVNLQYVIQSGGVDLDSGIIRITVDALALASFGGLIGFFLGRCKFEDEPVWWMPAGLTLAAVLNGLFNFFLGEVTTTSVRAGGYNPWTGLALAAAVAVVTFGILFYLIQRLGRQASHGTAA